MSRVNPISELTSGKITANDIGRSVYISNSKTVCQEWIIIGINHDNTSGTVDLMSKTSVWNPELLSNSRYTNIYMRDYGNHTYSNNNFDAVLKDEVLTGFTSEAQDAMDNMNVGWLNAGDNTSYSWFNENNYVSYVSSKIKLPSLIELNTQQYCSSWQMNSDGSYYPSDGQVEDVNTVSITSSSWSITITCNLGSAYEYFDNNKLGGLDAGYYGNISNVIKCADNTTGAWFITREASMSDNGTRCYALCKGKIFNTSLSADNYATDIVSINRYHHIEYPDEYKVAVSPIIRFGKR